jgi:CO dehydrogenase maturation factor
LGIKCYHSKVGAVELLLNHLIDAPKEYIVVDMTAGADSFASGLFTRFDLTFLVVEPTLKSIAVYQQYKKYAQDFGVKLKVIANKIENSSDLSFIQKHVGEDVLASFGKSQYVKAMEQGQFLALELLEAENQHAMQAMLNEIDVTQKNWPKFYSDMLEFHIKNTKSWANEVAGQDLAKQIDPEFSLAEIL